MRLYLGWLHRPCREYSLRVCSEYFADIKAQGSIFADIMDGCPMKVPYPIGLLGWVMVGRGLTRPAASDDPMMVPDCVSFDRRAAMDDNEAPKMVLDCVSVDRCAATVDDNEARLQRYQKHQQKRKIVIEVVKSRFAIYKVSQHCRGHPSVAHLPEPKTPDPCADIGNKKWDNQFAMWKASMRRVTEAYERSKKFCGNIPGKTSMVPEACK